MRKRSILIWILIEQLISSKLILYEGICVEEHLWQRINVRVTKQSHRFFKIRSAQAVQGGSGTVMVPLDGCDEEDQSIGLGGPSIVGFCQLSLRFAAINAFKID